MLNPTPRPFLTLETGFVALFFAAALALQAGFLGGLMRAESARADEARARVVQREAPARRAVALNTAAPLVHRGRAL